MLAFFKRYVQKCTQQQKWHKRQNFANNNLEANANEKTRGPPCKTGDFGEFGESGKNGKLVKIADNSGRKNGFTLNLHSAKVLQTYLCSRANL